MHLLCFGDSNTYGYDPHSWFGGCYPAEVRWTDTLARETGWTVTNRGMNGRSIPSGPFGTLSSADLLVVMLGSNDLLNGLSAEAAALRMEHFLSPLRSNYPRILLVAPPPMQWGDWVTEERLLTESAALAGCYEAVATRLGIDFVNAGAWKIELTFDGVHFSESGHHAFAEGLRRTLSPVNE